MPPLKRPGRGESGRGFAVVADEVRMLALRTRESVDETHDIISKIQVSGQAAVEDMERCLSQIQNSLGLTDTMGIEMGKAREVIEQLASLNLQMAEHINQQSDVSKDIASSVNTIRTSSEENSRQVQNVVNSMQGLQQHSQDLEQQLKLFVV